MHRNQKAKFPTGPIICRILPPTKATKAGEWSGDAILHQDDDGSSSNTYRGSNWNQTVHYLHIWFLNLWVYHIEFVVPMKYFEKINFCFQRREIHSWQNFPAKYKDVTFWSKLSQSDAVEELLLFAQPTFETKMQNLQEAAGDWIRMK